MDDECLSKIIQAIIQAAEESVSVERLEQILASEPSVTKVRIEKALSHLMSLDYDVQELRKVAGGYRFYIKSEYASWVAKQREEIEELPRALKETLAIIAYKQPISHGEVNLIRGKSTHYYVIEELLDRGWVKVVAHGGQSNRAALYGTTIGFLEYFNLNGLHDLPELENFQVLSEGCLQS